MTVFCAVQGPWGQHANVIRNALFVGFTAETEALQTPHKVDGIIQHCPPGNGVMPLRLDTPVAVALISC